MAYVPNYTTDDLPEIVGDVIGSAGVESKTYIPLWILAGSALLLSGAVATLVATWRK